jgi:topoisomerase-4 subunit A
MTEDEEEHIDNIPEEESSETPALSNTIAVSGMYQDWFLDYASYVILERAVPTIEDGLKPVQRRILHSMWELEDGRYNKVANVIGHTMKYHPHGDAAIGDAMVNIGQKELLIDTQGNWGNILTGDRAAAPRYIEARLSKFAQEILFNPKTTTWQLSYDGRNKEPVTLPVKFPLLLAQGVEGIAVGLSTKVLPHNFNELIDASIAILKGKKPVIYPDFQTGGMVDITGYNEGQRGRQGALAGQDRAVGQEDAGDHRGALQHHDLFAHRQHSESERKGQDQDQKGGGQHGPGRGDRDPSRARHLARQDYRCAVFLHRL